MFYFYAFILCKVTLDDLKGAIKLNVLLLLLLLLIHPEMVEQIKSTFKQISDKFIAKHQSGEGGTEPLKI